MIGALLAKLGLPLLVRAAGEGLGRIDHPAARMAATALTDAAGAIHGGAITPEQVAEANRHVERLAALESEQAMATLREVNTSLRAEVASRDAYVRRMRPTFGYIMAVSWGAQMGAVAWITVTDPANAGPVLAALSHLTTIWSVGLGVLGVYVYKRSEEKKTG